MELTSNNRLQVRLSPLSSGDITFALVATAGLSLVFGVLIAVAGGSEYIVFVLPLIAVLLLTISSLELAFAFLVLSLFVNVHVSAFSSAVWFSIPFALSFLNRYRDIEWSQFSNPVTRSILIYGCCILPSFFNAVRPFISLVVLYNVIAFLVVLYSCVASIKYYSDINKLLGAFLALVVVNSLDVFRLAWLFDKRTFGFSGVMFVDYSALAICVTAAKIILYGGMKRVLYSVLSVLIAVALVLTRTRNTLFSLLLTLCVFGFYLMLHPEFFGFSRKRLFVTIGAAAILILGGAALTVIMSPSIERRATDLSVNADAPVDQNGKIENSLVTRTLIWDTALNAFRAHPIIGIGVYAFSYSSQFYYRIPRYYFHRYVEGASPHQTELAVLTETGIVGLIGFMIFVAAALRTAFHSIRMAQTLRGRKYAMIAAIGVTYCIISMTFTDAWLWGQGIVLFGLVVGVMLAIRNLERSEMVPGAV